MMRTLALVIAVLMIAAPSQAYDLDYVGQTRTLALKHEDTLTYVARDYNLGYLELLAANPRVDPWIPGEGTSVTLPLMHILPDAPREGIVINLAEMRLYAFIDKDLKPVTFPLGVGREGLETPQGQTSIVRKINNPIWYPTKRMREEDPDLPRAVGPGIQNPLGTHALYLGWPQYLIHGTNRPFGIGRRVSSGCIRMYPEAIKQLYTLIDVDTPVKVVDQPIKAGWVGDEFYIEAHTNMDQSIELEADGHFTPVTITEAEKDFIKSAAGVYADQIDWSRVEDIVRLRTGVPIGLFTKPAKTPDNEKEPEAGA